jgi:hypothetical protein
MSIDLICNQQVVGSNPTAGSLVDRGFWAETLDYAWPLLGQLFGAHGGVTLRGFMLDVF